MLLYLVKNSRPNVANAACKLTKIMDKPNTVHVQVLYEAMKYIIDTKIKAFV